ncbi:hypothetical protein C1X16_04380 [Pseudomonas sp. FW305-3-2-15-C-R2A1]|nr:hypothetical protein C1X16_04380 [Pseudomonas sp. FW305-3-2-15-C-R2A1]
MHAARSLVLGLLRSPTRGKPARHSKAATQNKKRIHDAQRVALDLALRRPVKPRWPNAGLNPWVTRQDAGLAALGHGWPIAAEP